MIQKEAEEEKPLVVREYLKVGAAMAVAVCASLQGPEVLQSDLAGLRAHISRDKNGVMPHKPLKTGTDLSNAPHVIIVLIGHFKGKTGVHQHILSLASVTVSGIALRWWLEELIRIREAEDCTSGPTFGNANGSVTFLYEYNGILHHFLSTIQQEDPDLITENNDVKANYSFFHSFCKTAEGRAQAARLDSSVQNVMNRWRTIESAKDIFPCFNMTGHYSHACDLMPITWRYSYIQ
jgi:hypothetical protein